MDERAALCTRIGSAVRKCRRARGWSQEHLAERAKVSTHFIGLIERGLELPSLTTLLQLASVLGVTFEDLTRDTSVPEPWEADALKLLRNVPAGLRGGVTAMLRALNEDRPKEGRGKRKR